MEEQEPWNTYNRDKLPKGWAYPLGRDEIKDALISKGVHLTDLSFDRTHPHMREARNILSTYWNSDTWGKYFRGRGHESYLPPLRLGSVPSEQRLEIGQELREVWLDKALNWIQQAPDRGNVWTASSHFWAVSLTPDGALTHDET